MKKILSILLAMLMLLTMAACGTESGVVENGESGLSHETAATDDSDNSNDSDNKNDNEKIDVVLGNDPNNLLQSLDTMCFAEDRAFYLNSEWTLCSFNLDGTDLQEHCVISTDKLSSQLPCLNYYNGGIYFMAQTKVSDTVRSLEIRRYDISTGNVETIHTVAPESGWTYSGNMLIVNNTLCYSYSFSGEEKNNVEVLDLTTGNTNFIISDKSGGGTTHFGFDTDGKYLYMLWSGGVNEAGLKRVLLSELYGDAPKVEDVFDRPYYTQSYVLEDGGLYAVIQDKDTEEAIYGFYSHETFADALGKLQFEEYYPVVYKSYPETEQEYIENLAFDKITTDYILDGARVSVKDNNPLLELYYSNDLDWRKSSRVAVLEHAPNYPNNHYHVGEYNETLYFVLEDEEGNTTLHFLTADGTYQ